jgi:hypothetical protein
VPDVFGAGQHGRHELAELALLGGELARLRRSAATSAEEHARVASEEEHEQRDEERPDAAADQRVARAASILDVRTAALSLPAHGPAAEQDSCPPFPRFLCFPLLVSFASPSWLFLALLRALRALRGFLSSS